MDTTGEIIPMEKYIVNHGISSIAAATLATTATITSISATSPQSPSDDVQSSSDNATAVLVIPPLSPPVSDSSDDRVVLQKKYIHNGMARFSVRNHPYFQQTQPPTTQIHHPQQHQQQSNIEINSSGTTTTLRLVPSTGNIKSTKINVTQTMSDGGNKIIFHSYARANSKSGGDNSGNTSSSSNIISTSSIGSSSNNNSKSCNGLLAKRFFILDFYDGNSVHKCFDVKSKTEYVCKVIEEND